MSEPLSAVRRHIIDEALSWVGTPWVHMQRCKHVGVDCIQVTGAVGIAIGSLTEEQVMAVPYYSTQWHLHRTNQLLMNTLKSMGFTEVPLAQKQPGDVLLFQYARALAHSGIYLGDENVLHVPMQAPKKACVVRLQGDLQERLQKAFLFPGMAN